MSRDAFIKLTYTQNFGKAAGGEPDYTRENVKVWVTLATWLRSKPKTLSFLEHLHQTGMIKGKITPQHLRSGKFKQLDDDTAEWVLNQLISRTMSAKGLFQPFPLVQILIILILSWQRPKNFIP